MPDPLQHSLAAGVSLDGLKNLGGLWVSHGSRFLSRTTFLCSGLERCPRKWSSFEGGEDGGCVGGDAGERVARAAARVRRSVGPAVAARASARKRALVRARADRAWRPQELAADLVSARGDAGPVRVAAAVSGRLALGSAAA